MRRYATLRRKPVRLLRSARFRSGLSEPDDARRHGQHERQDVQPHGRAASELGRVPGDGDRLKRPERDIGERRDPDADPVVLPDRRCDHDAVKRELERGSFVDPAWVDLWDANFADLYLDALEDWMGGAPVPTPWRLAFEAASDPNGRPLVQVLVSMNAHINFDLPQSLAAMMRGDAHFDRDVVRRRQADFDRVDDILVSRVREEDLQLRAASKPEDYTIVDRLLTPFNRLASRRFLKESRRKVWRNAGELAKANRQGPEIYAERIRRLEQLCGAKVADLLRPGHVLLRLGLTGFGVALASEPTGED
jgi:Family of unknown function (DUF5995)